MSELKSGERFYYIEGTHSYMTLCLIQNNVFYFYGGAIAKFINAARRGQWYPNFAWFFFIRSRIEFELRYLPELTNYYFLPISMFPFYSNFTYTDNLFSQSFTNLPPIRVFQLIFSCISIKCFGVLFITSLSTYLCCHRILGRLL